MITLPILLWIIMSVVEADTKRLHDQLRLQNNLKIQELKKHGVSEDVIREQLSKSFSG